LHENAKPHSRLCNWVPPVLLHLRLKNYQTHLEDLIPRRCIIDVDGVTCFYINTKSKKSNYFHMYIFVSNVAAWNRERFTWRKCTFKRGRWRSGEVSSEYNRISIFCIEYFYIQLFISGSDVQMDTAQIPTAALKIFWRHFSASL